MAGSFRVQLQQPGRRRGGAEQPMGGGVGPATDHGRDPRRHAQPAGQVQAAVTATARSSPLTPPMRSAIASAAGTTDTPACRTARSCVSSKYGAGDRHADRVEQVPAGRFDGGCRQVLERQAGDVPGDDLR